MKIKEETLPSLAEMLREQVDAVSSLRTWQKLTPTRRRLMDRFMDACRDGKPFSEQDAAQVEHVLSSFCLHSFLTAKEAFIIREDDDIARLAAEGAAANFYEEFYAYQFIEKLDGIARRAAKVRHAFARTHPSAKVVAMCREAYQTYIFGYHAASAALIRSILEAQLKECLGCEVGTIGPLNDRARDEGLYGPVPQQRRLPIWDKVNEVAKRANSSVHNAKTPSEEENLHLIRLAQDVLQFLNR